MTSIGGLAFASCENLESVIIGESLTNYERFLDGCSKLSRVEFHCKEVNLEVLSYTTAINEVVFGDGVESIILSGSQGFFI